MIALWVALLGAALAGDAPAIKPPTATVHGDVKSFFFGIFPYDSPLMPPDPVAAGLLDGRLKLQAKWGPLTLTVHHELTVTGGGQSTLSVGPSTGVSTNVPEAVKLSWTGVDADTMVLKGRTDRLMLAGHFGPVSVTLGRQPISFGHGTMFTPLDLVGPFNPAVVDQEYKPGYDAVRVDGFWGMGGQVTAVAAYAGDWSLDGSVGVLYGQDTVGVTDIGLFAGDILGDPVFGATVASSIGPVGVHSDAAFTVSSADGNFFRGVVGADWRPTGNTTLSGEFYVQTLGASDPSGYLTFATNDRFARGELWLLGRYYAGVALSQQITPLITGTAAVIANLGDPSMLLVPTIDWSVAENADLGAGAFLGVGKRPDGLTLNSEFGLYPVTAFVEVKTYF